MIGILTDKVQERRDKNWTRSHTDRNTQYEGNDRREGEPRRDRQRDQQKMHHKIPQLPNSAARVLATIAGGTAGGRETSSQRKRHLKAVMTVKRILIDSGSSADIIFWETFRAMNIPEQHLILSCTNLLGFSRECVQPKGTIEILVTFEIMLIGRTAKVCFYIIDCASAYNVILGCQTIGALGAIISMPHLLMKFRSPSVTIVSIRGDQKAAHSCYNTNLMVNNKSAVHQDTKGKASINMTDLDMREDFHNVRPQPDAADIPGLDPYFIGRHLIIGPQAKLVAQKKCKISPQKQNVVDDEVTKLLDTPVIREITYSMWLSNVVLLVDNLAGYQIFSYMDAYSGYNQIPMFKQDVEATTFITEKETYCYNMMPFGLKNVGATYQCMMNKVFSEQIGRMLEVYINDMIVKTTATLQHPNNLEHVFQQLRKYKLRLHPAKCVLGVPAGKFL
ncbi:uncharacterized protein LOC133291443 [Gastrolobium bilobum]|uniref:uncharacterized protein LOC133291443 n=1 Tax=Gastrolobium bilobum TaxID=150636 RepID=UPI002AAF4A1E|nr:uncharacterized protein LOC133291443 [Gastrolobium bilobum]